MQPSLVSVACNCRLGTRHRLARLPWLQVVSQRTARELRLDASEGSDRLCKLVELGTVHLVTRHFLGIAREASLVKRCVTGVQRDLPPGVERAQRVVGAGRCRART